MLGTSLKVTARASDKRKGESGGIVSRNSKDRQGAETGVIACVIDDKGFGFITCVERDMRVFFHLQECEDASFNGEDPDPGDYVEFLVEADKKGNRAVALRKLPLDTLEIDEVDDSERIRGFVTREPKDYKSASSFPKLDHELAKKVATTHLTATSFGKIVIGFPDGDDTQNGAMPSKEDAPIDWRREKELQNLVKKFNESEEDLLEIKQNLTSKERKLIVKLVDKTISLHFRKFPDLCVIAKSSESIDEYEKTMNGDTSTEDTKDEAVDGTKPEDLKEGDSAADTGDADDKNANAENSEKTEASKPNQAEKAVEPANKGAKGGSEANVHVKNRTESGTLISYFFSSVDIDNPYDESWIPLVGDQVEFSLCKNRATKKTRATKIKLISSGSKIQRGVIDGTVRARYGFVRPLVGGEGTKGLFPADSNRGKVDEAFKPGAGGRDGTVRFEASEIHGGMKLFDGDEVEYRLVINGRTKEAKAVRLKLIKRGELEIKAASSKERKVVNKDILAKIADQSQGVLRFHQAKKPDGTIGFPVGRGRNIPVRTILNATAKEFKPSFLT